MIKNWIREKLIKTLDKMGIEEIPDFKIEIPLNNFGDYSSNIAFLLSKKLKQNPRNIALDISKHLDDKDYFNKIEVAGPGFLNFFLNEKVYSEFLLFEYENPQYWKKASNKKILFEFASVNPTGPITIGHGRQAVYGDVLCNIFKTRGHSVEREIYLNNAGRQIRLLGRSLWIRYNNLFKNNYDIPEGGYKGEYLIQTAKKLKDEIKDKFVDKWDSSIADFFNQYAFEAMFEGMKETFDNLSIKFNNIFKEKSLVDDGSVDKVLKELKEKNLTYESEGALWFKVSKFKDEKDKVLIRSDGYYTYYLTDIAYHINKYNRNYEKAYDIFGADHVGHLDRMYAALDAFDIPESFLIFILHQYVNLKKNGEIIKMSTRAGNFETLDDLVTAVGKDATRYFFARFDPDTQMLFDIDLAKQKTNENPVFYVQYAHARISNIFKNAAEKNILFEEISTIKNLNSEEEKNLIKEIDRFEEILDSILIDYKINKLTNYLESLASFFHSFYSKHIIVDENDIKTTKERLALCRAVQNTLKGGLSLLGVSAPENM